MQKQYSVEYVGAPNLPSGGLEYRFPKIGKVHVGHKKVVFLTDDRYAEAHKLPGLEVKLVAKGGVRTDAVAEVLEATQLADAVAGVVKHIAAESQTKTKPKKRGSS